MGGNVVAFDRLLNVRHVAGDALTARTVFGVMGMLGNGAFESSRIPLGVACKAKSVAFFNEVGFVLIAVDLMAVEATKLTMVHVALDEVVPLHPVLVCGQVGVLEEIRRARFQFLELPSVRQKLAWQKANWPVVIFAADGVAERTPLAVALNAHVIASNVVQ